MIGTGLQQGEQGAGIALLLCFIYILLRNNNIGFHANLLISLDMDFYFAIVYQLYVI